MCVNLTLKKCELERKERVHKTKSRQGSQLFFAHKQNQPDFLNCSFDTKFLYRNTNNIKIDPELKHLKVVRWIFFKFLRKLFFGVSVIILIVHLIHPGFELTSEDHESLFQIFQFKFHPSFLNARCGISNMQGYTYNQGKHAQNLRHIRNQLMTSLVLPLK